MEPYYADDTVTLYLGDCREITEWLAADVLVTDPPYGIAWRMHARGPSGLRAHDGIANDDDATARDAALTAWGERPAATFGSFYGPAPASVRHVLVYKKGAAAGMMGAWLGWHRDLEPIYLTGQWPRRGPRGTSLIQTRALGAGQLCPASRYGHPHAKPVDVMEALIFECPPGIIADPFAGSGSTLVAARNLGRRAIGVEIEERYCEAIVKRLQQDVLPMEAS